MKENIREQLYALAEGSYRDFSAALVPGCGTMLGVRLPKLRALAKEIAKDYDTYFTEPCGELFEEIMLRGMVIGCMKCSTEQRLQKIRDFLPLIDNWSVCDSFCCGLKEAKKKPEIYWDFLLPYLHSEQEFEIRFGVVMLLAHFAHDEWLPKVLEQLEQIIHTGYYVKMAVAWAASVCYIRDAELTWNWLQHMPLDAETEHMALQKIMDSRRVKGIDRERIQQLRQQRKQV
ncbi:MAG: DNA alkylation repair protein [Eubacteriales bacterium]|nr:DNA alkylation repair protein [Eubacteriales bacterium]